MNFSTHSQSHSDHAQLLILREKSQAHSYFAVLADTLDENTFFAQADVIVDNKLQSLAVLLIQDFNIENVQKRANEIAQWLSKQPQLDIDLNLLSDEEILSVAPALQLALAQAAYRFYGLKKDVKAAKLEAVHFIEKNQILANAIAETNALIDGINLCKDLGNTAPNICTPEYLVHTAKNEAEKLGAKVVIREQDYIQSTMGSFWAVAKGSKEAPYLLEMSWQGAKNADEAPIVLVGKGITFDTGGISLKRDAGMDEMKFDMCGSATVIGTFIAAVKAKLPINLIAVVPTCENMPDGAACKPGDVVTAMNGTTIEILNTDAEGRLILCDALTYAEQFKPKAIIDVATLTGACVMTFADVASGLMANQQNLADELLNASRQTNDKIWQLPLFDEYKEQLQSNFADLPNIGSGPAGTITAALFLAHFMQNSNWAHLDIAGTAWKKGKEKGATGRTVGLLFQYLKNQIS